MSEVATGTGIERDRRYNLLHMRVDGLGCEELAHPFHDALGVCNKYRSILKMRRLVCSVQDAMA